MEDCVTVLVQIDDRQNSTFQRNISGATYSIKTIEIDIWNGNDPGFTPNMKCASTAVNRLERKLRLLILVSHRRHHECHTLEQGSGR
ncbi:Hypothetical protein I596_348 [Dokdonella koreensis DS-123]|uniref:Uncharacterized protein n=1 Tax=Dokdonella koreensis DS-123 TaxID=1300342 RepID=A0A167GBY8_9GAMM|nr:Hypothetical protein I596_348 [Dokdonella koreensis DS-123]